MTLAINGSSFDAPMVGATTSGSTAYSAGGKVSFSSYPAAGSGTGRTAIVERQRQHRLLRPAHDTRGGHAALRRGGGELRPGSLHPRWRGRRLQPRLGPQQHQVDDQRDRQDLRRPDHAVVEPRDHQHQRRPLVDDRQGAPGALHRQLAERHDQGASTATRARARPTPSPTGCTPRAARRTTRAATSWKAAATRGTPRTSWRGQQRGHGDRHQLEPRGHWLRGVQLPVDPGQRRDPDGVAAGP